jgi:hypothetical protein
MLNRLSQLLIIIFVGSCLSFGQESSPLTPTPRIKLEKLSWKKETPLPRGWDRPIYSASSPSSYDPHSAPASGRNRSTIRKGQRNPYYSYSAKITNLDNKTIEAVAWDYRVADAATALELSKHSFRSYNKIAKNKTVTLTGRSSEPPSRVVSVVALEKNSSSPFIEQAIIKCVIYSDGAEWKNPFSPDGDCERLRLGAQRRK